MLHLRNDVLAEGRSALGGRYALTECERVLISDRTIFQWGVAFITFVSGSLLPIRFLANGLSCPFLLIVGFQPHGSVEAVQRPPVG